MTFREADESVEKNEKDDGADEVMESDGRAEEEADNDVVVELIAFFNKAREEDFENIISILNA